MLYKVTCQPFTLGNGIVRQLPPRNTHVFLPSGTANAIAVATEKARRDLLSRQRRGSQLRFRVLAVQRTG